MIKVRKLTLSFSEYRKNEFDGDFLSLGLKWEQVFGKDNLICRIFDAGRNTVIEEFLSCLPVESPLVSHLKSELPDSMNVSLGFAALTVKRMFNTLRRGACDSTLDVIPHELVELFQDIDIPAILMNSKEAGRFRKRYKKINRMFSERYLGKSMSDLGGRRYSDAERDDLYRQCKALVDTNGL